jgi:hypothetical protein
MQIFVAMSGYVGRRTARLLYPAAVPSPGRNVAYRGPSAFGRVARLSARQPGRPAAERRDGVMAGTERVKVDFQSTA